jgi:transposase-like protein
MVPKCLHIFYTDDFSGIEETSNNCVKIMHTGIPEGSFTVYTSTIQKSKISSAP